MGSRSTLSEVPTLPPEPTTIAEWQEAVDTASVVLNLAYAEQGSSVEGEHEGTIKRAMDLIERGQALGVEPERMTWRGDDK